MLVLTRKVGEETITFASPSSRSGATACVSASPPRERREYIARRFTNAANSQLRVTWPANHGYGSYSFF
jgi:hypothetical protein